MAHEQVRIHTTRVEETQAVGEQIGSWIHEHGGPLCVALTGDLGVGKTHLTQGIGKGLRIPDEMTSPTFALMNTYQSSVGMIYHFDVYRLDDVSELENIGFYEYTEDQISIVEWADKFQGELPDETLWVNIERESDTDRSIVLESSCIAEDELLRMGGSYVVRD